MATASRPLSCVIVHPAAGLLPWQRRCVEQLCNALDVSVADRRLSPSKSGQHRSSTIARWLDAVTRPRCARGRNPFARMHGTCRWPSAAGDAADPRRSADPGHDGVHSAAPDIILAFDCEALSDSDDTIARLGVWYFSEGATQRAVTGRPGVDALAAGASRLTLTLYRRDSDHAAPIALARGHTPAVAHSRKRSLARLYEIAPELLSRAIGDARSGPASSTAIDPVPAHAPVGWTRFLIAMLQANVRRWYEKMALVRRWDIGFLDGRLPIPDMRDIAAAHWVDGPRDGFWADPCFVADTATPTLLVEEYRNDTGRGEITRLAWPDSDIRGAPRAEPVLRLDGHLSFPRSYAYAGRRWLVPEMAACGAQRAYRLDGETGLPRAESVALVGLAGIDPVVFQHAGRYWAFICPAGRRANYQLDLYLADDFFGPYRRHPASPVRIDPHGGRSAGPVLRDGDRLLRFGQVFGRHYGQAIDVFEITELTPERYGEERITRIQPEPSTGAGMHTIDFAPGLTVVDRFRLEPLWRITLARLRRSG